MEISLLILLFFVGILVGFINIVSAGGSMLTLPILIFMGLPSSTANGTNRIGIIVQNISAMMHFRKNNLFDWKLGLILSFPAVIGSIYGANLAIDLSDKIFNNTLGIFMLIIIVLLTVKPQRYLKKVKIQSNVLRITLIIVAFLIVGFYGGFIQAGVGFIIIIALLLLYPNKTLVEMHSIKTFVITIYLLISTFVFIINGNVNWTFAIVLALGSAIGGNLGGRFASKVPEKVLQTILIAVVSIISIKLFLGS
ncbi:hypothetical protein CSV69_11695 [Sporosarcina sp. P26b]|uniref:sulfite exporter TauE/SafE family protein n=1 Tax=Sporosarcina sp. P26b TaxID=2048253 RepID=UPI000C1668F8|nr:sulfite exporter TauE/SafE family protein [Sporosarcina sp. P26b]PIC95377.1 hypothetical protein CSV69_11695 [Sporosarcina sp. P26b]